MKPKRFDTDALRALAGDKVFARGQAYAASGQVQILEIGAARVLAHVAGTDDYRAELTGSGTKIDGRCSCPAFRDFGFCKHMVATALVANTAGGSSDVEARAVLPRIRAHLKKRGVDALVALILDLAERDPALLRRLELEQAAGTEDDATLEQRLRKSIDLATRPGRFIDYEAAPSWAAGLEQLLDGVAALVPNDRAALALKLACHAIDRIERASETVDDSDGCCSDLIAQAADIYLKAALAVRPEPVTLARDLFTRETRGETDVFTGAAFTYEAVLGAPGLAEYRKLAQAAWDQVPVRTGRGRQGHVPVNDGFLVRRILDRFAERDGDLDARIALRSKDLSTALAHLQLAEFCRANGRPGQALRYAEDGLFLFADERQDERLVVLAASLLAEAGRAEDAAALLWRAFERQPSLDLYRHLAALHGRTAATRAVAFLQSCLHPQAGKPRGGIVDILIGILMMERQFEAAWSVAREQGASMQMMEALARNSEDVCPHDALRTYALLVEHLAGAGGKTSYADAAALATRMARLQTAADQAVFMADLRERHRRKSNFLKLLAACPPAGR